MEIEWYVNPKVASCYTNRGLIYYSKKNYDAALVDYNRAIELAPHHEKAYSNREALYKAMKKLKQAE